MPPKTETTTFSFEVMSGIIAVMEKKGATLGRQDYALLARLDGTRSESGFEHLFRAVKKRGKEIAATIDSTDTTPKKSKKTVVPTSSAKKRSSKAMAKNYDDEDDLDDTKTPSKRSKYKKEPSMDASADGDNEAIFD